MYMNTYIYKYILYIYIHSYIYGHTQCNHISLNSVSLNSNLSAGYQENAV